ncbi:unnamed protein product [Nippostrongylus brasiliensis]|uniref:UDENN domain-containing protein n=1 Tax=Nippostrongylus brasiliensis TaxID=27835 RepID=A0A0N4Y264_NIPBR|nr:unnamed protein product [Nippostrongylus brasiliensis]
MAEILLVQFFSPWLQAVDFHCSLPPELFSQSGLPDFFEPSQDYCLPKFTLVCRGALPITKNPTDQPTQDLSMFIQMDKL